MTKVMQWVYDPKLKIYNEHGKRICSVPKCENVHDARSLCATHRLRLKKGLDLLVPVRKYNLDGKKLHPLFTTYRRMISRCYDQNDGKYHRYGGRGIKVCDRWLNDFWAFVEDVGEKPTPRHSMDRYPDNNGNYELSNFRWATYLEQNINQNIRHDNKSGTRGVFFRKDKNRWVAYITANQKRTHLGHFEFIDDAIKARKDAEKKYWQTQ